MKLLEFGDSKSIESQDKPKYSKSVINEIDADVLGAKRGGAAQSKSWGSNTDPWNAVSLTRDGTLLLRLRDIRFTIVHYETPGNPGSYITFRATWEPQGWTTSFIGNDGITYTAVRFQDVEVLESGGGTVETMQYFGSVICPATEPFVVFARKDLDPDIFDIVTGWKIPGGRRGTWQRC